MLIFTAKLQRKRIKLGLIAFVAVCLLLALYAGFHNHWNASPSSTVSANATSVTTVKNNGDRIAYLSQYGWAVSPEPLAIEKMEIPTVFDSSFDRYLAIQEEEGFSPKDYAGKLAKRYTYAITNYPNGEDDMMVSILVYQQKVSAGEVFSSATGEILHGLSMPSQK